MAVGAGDWRDGDSSWVLDHGLPDDLPQVVPADLLVPVAYWVGAKHAVVMSLQWSEDQDDIHEHRLHTETEVYRRQAGKWAWTGSGGSGWPEARLVPPPLAPRECRFRHLHCQRQGDEVVISVDGVVGSDAASVVAIDRHGTISSPVRSPVRAVIALVEPESEATVTVLDTDGEAIGGVVIDRNGTFQRLEI